MKLTNEFQSIRDWAMQRGLYDKGDVKTQFIKLSEEVGELGKAILNNNQNEVIDAIGDIVVVLTNLTELSKIDNTKIEDCINSAYSVIANRQGKMQNGTFIKDK